MEFHRGRLIDHILVTVKDIEVTKRFYTAVLAEIDVPVDREGEDWFLADELMFKQANRRFGRIQLALQAGSEEAVRCFYDTALAFGGKRKHPPDYITSVHPYYFSAAVTDPDGNVIESVCHGPIKRSAGSIVLRPSGIGLLKSVLTRHG